MAAPFKPLHPATLGDSASHLLATITAEGQARPLRISNRQALTFAGEVYSQAAFCFEYDSATDYFLFQIEPGILPGIEDASASVIEMDGATARAACAGRIMRNSLGDLFFAIQAS